MKWDLILSTAIYAAIAPQTAAYCLGAIGINVHFGYTGLLNFGQAAFMAVGAYGLAMGINTWGLNFWLAIFLGIFAAVMLALLLGIPTLRLRADYLAIVTIAAAEIIRLILRSVRFGKWTGGSSGINQFAQGFEKANPFGEGRHQLWRASFSDYDLWVIVVGWGLVILCSLFVYYIMKSPWGRVLKSIREDEEAPRSLGKNVFSFKMQSLIIGGVIGAFGGFVIALGTRSVQPDVFGTPITFFAYTILILGGTARVKGPIIGSMIFWFLISFVDITLRQAVAANYIPDWLLKSSQVGQVRYMLVGLGLILLMAFRPQGIFGDRRELDLDAH